MGRAYLTDYSKRDHLTTKQLEVLRLGKEGLSLRETGERLFITEQTVKYHRTNAFRKLGVHNLAEATEKLTKKGIFPCSCESHEKLQKVKILLTELESVLNDVS